MSKITSNNLEPLVEFRQAHLDVPRIYICERLGKTITIRITFNLSSAYYQMRIAAGDPAFAQDIYIQALAEILTITKNPEAKAVFDAYHKAMYENSQQFENQRPPMRPVTL